MSLFDENKDKASNENDCFQITKLGQKNRTQKSRNDNFELCFSISVLLFR